MRSTAQQGTAAELRVRRELHKLGLRYFVNRSVVKTMRRRADIVFVGAKVAVFIDGCFWHSCPTHATKPKANADWWAAKLATNGSRDRDTDYQLRQLAWLPVHVWEHEPPVKAARRIAGIVRRRTRHR